MDLFGRGKYEAKIKELEARISELLEDKREMASTLEKREDKIRTLASALQEANLALKASEKRALSAQMRPELEKAEVQKIRGFGIKPREMEKLLQRLQGIKSPEEDLLSAYIGSPKDLPPSMQKEAASIKSERGLAVLHCPQLFLLFLVPPMPIRELQPTYGSTFQLENLQEILDTPVIVISAHAGDTFLGFALSHHEFEEENVVESQIKERHSKGGWSQKRFERLREEDIQSHAGAVREMLLQMAERYRSIAKYAIIGGDAMLLKLLSPAIGLPVVERRLERHESIKTEMLLNEVYQFKCFRSSGQQCDL